MKKLIAMLLALAMVFALVACGSTSSSSGNASNGGASQGGEELNYDRNGDGEVIIAYSAIAYSIAVLPQALYDNLQAECDNRGWTFMPLAAEGDVALQAEQVTQLIQQDPDFFVLFPADPALAIDMCQEMADADIPCVTVHVNSGSEDNVLAYCGPDNYTMAYNLAMALIDANGADAGLKIVQIGGVPVQSDYIERVQGFNDAIAEKSNYEILGDVAWAYSSRADAQTAMENFITTYGEEIDVLVGYDDDLTLGGVNALQEKGMTDVQVYSITGQEEAMQAIQNGTMSCTAFYTTANESDDVFAVIDAYVAGTIDGLEHHQATSVVYVNAENVAEYADKAEF